VQKIVRLIEENRSVTARDLQRNDEINHKRLSISTFERFLNDKGYKARKKQKVHFIRGPNLILRKNWG
jgi:hypothetical protein